jgi:hypothetical protein
MKMLVTAGAFALALSMSSPAAAQQQGDWVLGQWQGNSEWYPGVIQSRSGNQIAIRYDDGTVETRPINQVRPFNWQAGTRVVCRYTDGSWYDATITRMDAGGLTVDLRYDDGETQRTQTGRCRTD